MRLAGGTAVPGSPAMDVVRGAEVILALSHQRADTPPPRLRSFEGSPDHPRQYLFADRRPDTYRELSRVG